MNTTKTIAALFDFDGVIMDTETQYTVFWDEQGRKYLNEEDFGRRIKGQTLLQIYENVLNAMAETSASIIGNNQNTIMKTLALMTMALDIPTVIFSAYGMNFKNNSMPLNDLDNAFWVIFFMAVFGSSCVVIYFIRKKWF